MLASCAYKVREGRGGGLEGDSALGKRTIVVDMCVMVVLLGEGLVCRVRREGRDRKERSWENTSSKRERGLRVGKEASSGMGSGRFFFGGDCFWRRGWMGMLVFGGGRRSCEPNC